MKLEHWIIMFVAVAAILFTYIFIDAKYTTKQNTLTTQYTDYLTESMYDISQTTNWNFEKEEARLVYIDSFRNRLAASLHYDSDGEMFDYMMRRVPVLVFGCNDGFYMYYSDTTVSGGMEVYTKTMTPKIPYSKAIGSYSVLMSFTGYVTVKSRSDDREYTGLFSDVYAQMGSPAVLSFLENEDDYLTKVSETASELVGESMESMMRQHFEEFADANSYVLNLPVGKTDTLRTITGPCTVALFQGGITTSVSGEVVNVYSMAASDLTDTVKYNIYLESDGTNSYLYYHHDGCSHESAGTFVYKGSMAECAKKGAFPCPDCVLSK